MLKVNVDKRILDICPQMKIGLIQADVVNGDTCDELWNELLKEANNIKNSYELLAINKRPAVAATRKVYKALGKDPGRYRVASEALCRRIIRGLGLYRLTTLIDVVNLVSIKSGYAISGLDFDKIEGDTLTLGVGEAGEVYNGIGRGALNWRCGYSNKRRRTNEIHPRNHYRANQHQWLWTRNGHGGNRKSDG